MRLFSGIRPRRTFPGLGCRAGGVLLFAPALDTPVLVRIPALDGITDTVQPATAGLSWFYRARVHDALGRGTLIAGYAQVQVA